MGTKTKQSMLLGGATTMLLSSPAVIKAINGFTLSLVTKIETTLLTRFPRIVNLASGGLDSIEAKLKEYNQTRESNEY